MICSGDIEVIKQLNRDMESVIGKFSSLCKSKDLFSMFDEMSHYSDMTLDKDEL